MSVGIVDSTVIIHYYRGQANVTQWLASQTQQLSVTHVTWMEIMVGARNKASQAKSKQILGLFETLYLTTQDQQWSMQQLEKFQFSHHIGIHDCQIASIAYRLQIPLYTHNLKHMTPLIGNLAQRPY